MPVKNYVTFGQGHVHLIGNQTIDCDCVVTYDSIDTYHGRKRAFELFDGKFSIHQTDSDWDEDKSLGFYPRGYIEIPN